MTDNATAKLFVMKSLVKMSEIIDAHAHLHVTKLSSDKCSNSVDMNTVHTRTYEY